jgi:hypothetical protein
MQICGVEVSVALEGKRLARVSLGLSVLDGWNTTNGRGTVPVESAPSHCRGRPRRRRLKRAAWPHLANCVPIPGFGIPQPDWVDQVHQGPRCYAARRATNWSAAPGHHCRTHPRAYESPRKREASTWDAPPQSTETSRRAEYPAVAAQTAFVNPGMAGISRRA